MQSLPLAARYGPVRCVPSFSLEPKFCFDESGRESKSRLGWGCSYTAKTHFDDFVSIHVASQRNFPEIDGIKFKAIFKSGPNTYDASVMKDDKPLVLRLLSKSRTLDEQKIEHFIYLKEADEEEVGPRVGVLPSEKLDELDYGDTKYLPMQYDAGELENLEPLSLMIQTHSEINEKVMRAIAYSVLKNLFFWHKNDFYHDGLSVFSVFRRKNSSSSAGSDDFILMNPWLWSNYDYTFFTQKIVEDFSIPHAGDILSLGGILYQLCAYTKAEPARLSRFLNETDALVAEINAYIYYAGTRNLMFCDDAFRKMQPSLFNFLQCCLIFHRESRTTAASLLLHPFLDDAVNGENDGVFKKCLDSSSKKNLNFLGSKKVGETVRYYNVHGFMAYEPTFQDVSIDKSQEKEGKIILKGKRGLVVEYTFGTNKYFDIIRPEVILGCPPSKSK